MADKIPFLEMFPGCEEVRHLCGGLDRAEVREVLIVRETMTMQADVHFPVMPAPADLTQLEEHLAAQYRLRGLRRGRRGPHRHHRHTRLHPQHQPHRHATR